jgi:glutamate mutase epsilon subunit
MIQEIFKEWATEIFTALISVAASILGFRKLQVVWARDSGELAEANANTASMKNLHTQIQMLSIQNEQLAHQLNLMQSQALAESIRLHEEIRVLRNTIEDMESKCYQCVHKPK